MKFENGNYEVLPYISTKAENPIEIIQWVDWMYSDEGVLECAWGVEGETYTIDDSGTKTYTEFVTNNPDGLTADEVYRHYLMRDCIMVWDWDAQLVMYEDPKYQECWDVWTGNADLDEEMPSTLTMTIDENDEYSKKMADITTYVIEMSSKFIMGVEPMENYDTFLSTLEKMGVAEVVAIQQAALDRYNLR